MKLLLALFASVVGGWIIVNLIGALIVGAIARVILPGKDRVGWGMTILVGFLGGIVGKLFFGIMHWYSGFPMGFVASVLGAFALLIAHRAWIAGKGGAAAR